MRASLSTLSTLCLLFGSLANASVSPECVASLTQITRGLLRAEGFEQINTCGGIGSSENCQLEFYSCQQPDPKQNQVCYLRYTYGGGYPNMNDYAMTIDGGCHILQINITRQ